MSLYAAKGAGRNTVRFFDPMIERGIRQRTALEVDLRRALDAGTDVRMTPIAEVMTVAPKTIDEDALAVEAARLMEAHKINALVVLDADRQVVGALNVHDLLRARVV